MYYKTVQFEILKETLNESSSFSVVAAMFKNLVSNESNSSNDYSHVALLQLWPLINKIN